MAVVKETTIVLRISKLVRDDSAPDITVPDEMLQGLEDYTTASLEDPALFVEVSIER